MSGLPTHFDPQDKCYWFRKLRDAEVPAGIRQLAADVFDFVVNDLDLGDLAPRLVWVRPEQWQVADDEHLDATRRLTCGQDFQCDCFCEVEDFDGMVPNQGTREIFIRSDLSEAALKKAIAHELRHLYQKKTRGVTSLDGGSDCEEDAYSYCNDAVARFEENRRR